MFVRLQDSDLYQMSDEQLVRLEDDLGPERWHSQEGRLVRMEQERRRLTRESKAKTRRSIADLHAAREASPSRAFDLPLQLLGRNLTEKDKEHLADFVRAVVAEGRTK